MNSVPDLETTDFTPQDFAARLARIRKAMERAEIDTLIMTDPSNMCWTTGYDGWSFYVHQAVIVGPEGAPIWWGRGIDAAGARRTIIGAPDDAIRSYDDSFVQSDEKHPMENLAALLEEKGWQKGIIGVELENYYYSAKAHATLTAHLPQAHFVDATALVNWQRAVKSATEIERMRRAARIVESMHRTILEVAEPGLPKNRLVAEILRASALGVEGHWGDYPAIVPMTPSGLDATAPHLTWDDRPMQEGESHFFEIAGVYRRYHCPLSRTLFFGEPPAKYRHAEEAVQEATAAGLAQARPGNACEDIANAFNTTLERHGFYKENRCGYSIGLSYPPDWGERTMSLRRTDTTVLEPGMCFHFMPALWLDDGGLEITESILITDSGAEKFCALPGEIYVKP
jgi:ectoine hydrolase